MKHNVYDAPPVDGESIERFLIYMVERMIYMDNDELMKSPEEVSKELLERLIRIETQLDIMLQEFRDAQPRISYLEREVERQRDSLKQAHNRIDAQDKRYYWIMGILVTMVASLFVKFAG